MTLTGVTVSQGGPGSRVPRRHGGRATRPRFEAAQPRKPARRGGPGATPGLFSGLRIESEIRFAN